MRKVIIESPYSGDTLGNVRYAKECLLDCLDRGEAPIASHLLYTQVLDDTDSEERTIGMLAGHAWAEVADAVVVYNDFGISDGMHLGIEAAIEADVPVEYRSLIE